MTDDEDEESENERNQNREMLLKEEELKDESENQDDEALKDLDDTLKNSKLPNDQKLAVHENVNKWDQRMQELIDKRNADLDKTF